MKKALISPEEKVTNTNSDIGQRIAQVEPEDQIFEVADPLFWTDCADECLANEWFYFNFQCVPLE